MRPAPAGHGIRFLRADVGVEIPAHVSNLGKLDHATSLVREGVSIDTVEHILSALQGLGVDDVLVEVNGPEVPILDGSAAPFVLLIHEAGLRPHAMPRQHLKVLKEVEVVRGGKWARLLPSDHLRISYSIGFDHPLLRQQSLSVRVTAAQFAEEIAPARTFGFLRDVETLRRNGLALGGSLENAIVIGEGGVLNKLRFEDEFVRHKILDALGDLALLGYPLLGHLEASKAGHALHAAVVLKLLADEEAWSLVGQEPQRLPALERPQALPQLVPEPS